jgi:hypothetical protein
VNLLAWIGIVVGGWFLVSVVASFAIAWVIGRGWMQASRHRDVAGIGVLSRLD